MPARPALAARHVARQALNEAARRGELALPEAVRALRQALGLTQEEFGRLARLTRRQVSELENAAGDPKLSTLTRIGRIFGLTVGFVPKQADSG